jgi:UDP-N-acetyl-D-glucosamine dehydrogenase
VGAAWMACSDGPSGVVPFRAINLSRPAPVVRRVPAVRLADREAPGHSHLTSNGGAVHLLVLVGKLADSSLATCASRSDQARRPRIHSTQLATRLWPHSTRATPPRRLPARTRRALGAGAPLLQVRCPTAVRWLAGPGVAEGQCDHVGYDAAVDFAAAVGSGQAVPRRSSKLPIDVVIVGLGYVGLPLGREAASAGLSVLGFDVDARVVDGLSAGSSHVDDLTDADIAKMLGAGFRATTDETAIASADVVLICVPTPLSRDGGPDLGAVTSAVEIVARHLRSGMLVVLESTTYPGTTDEIVRPLLESSGLVAGVDFHLAFSPERIDPGNEQYGPRNTPRVVGGHTPACSERAAAFYGKFVDTVVRTKGTREAETAKLLENTYRHINIALVNEMARFCHELGIDLWDVIRAASTKPFGFQAFYPGPGVGGHCIPIDPNYLSHNVRARLGYPFRFVELAQEINATMPSYVAHRAQNILNAAGKPVRGSSVLLLGVTYKPNIADQRESPAVPLARQLLGLGAVVSYHDPRVTDWTPGSAEVRPIASLDEAVPAADLVILLQNHREYDADALATRSQLFFDTRGVTSVEESHRL